MISRNQVDVFLRELKVKIEIFGILFLDERGKNAQALLDLNVTPVKRIEIVKNLKPEEYSQGPINEEM